MWKYEKKGEKYPVLDKGPLGLKLRAINKYQIWAFQIAAKETNSHRHKSVYSLMKLWLLIESQSNAFLKVSYKKF